MDRYKHLQNRIGIYVHWPFCLKKCPYCDFNVHLNNREEDETWVEAYLQSLEYYAGRMDGRGEVVSIFFGGGTPSLMPPVLVERLIGRVAALFPVSDDLEVTLEANPTSAEMEKFRDFRSAGVNRLSVGVQSLRDEALQFLGRAHNAGEGLRAIEMAREIFERFSFDLIYARPGQSLAEWEAELVQALRYAGGHLSLYELTIEEQTPFYKRHARGEFQIPDEDRASEFFLRTYEIMKGHGLPPYEISNYGAAGQECLYNVLTWMYEDYIGIGPGAHGRITAGGGRVSTCEARAPGRWLSGLRETGYGWDSFDALDGRDRFEEALITGLRMTGGVAVSHVEEKSGLSFDAAINAQAFGYAAEQGWLVRAGDVLFLSEEGLLRYDAITRALLLPASGRG